jgi:hypothetical protein
MARALEVETSLPQPHVRVTILTTTCVSCYL